MAPIKGELCFLETPALDTRNVGVMSLTPSYFWTRTYQVTWFKIVQLKTAAICFSLEIRQVLWHASELVRTRVKFHSGLRRSRILSWQDGNRHYTWVPYSWALLAWGEIDGSTTKSHSVTNHPSYAGYLLARNFTNVLWRQQLWTLYFHLARMDDLRPR